MSVGTVLHVVAGLACSEYDRDENGGKDCERRVELVDLGQLDQSRMRYEVRVTHPPFVQPPQGQRSRQMPELFRFAALADAERSYRALVAALGGDPKDCPEPPSETVSRADFDALNAKLDQLLRR